MIDVIGAPGTLYANETYQLQVDFPDHYPMEAPQVDINFHLMFFHFLERQLRDERYCNFVFSVILVQLRGSVCLWMFPVTEEEKRCMSCELCVYLYFFFLLIKQIYGWVYLFLFSIWLWVDHDTIVTVCQVIFLHPAPMHPHIYSNGHICLGIFTFSTFIYLVEFLFIL